MRKSAAMLCKACQLAALSYPAKTAGTTARVFSNVRELHFYRLGKWTLTVSDVDPRYHVYRAVSKEKGYIEEVIICPNGPGLKTRAIAREVVLDYVAKNGYPEEIFCFNDERAIAVLDALRDLNYRAPQNVLLIAVMDLMKQIITRRN